MSRSDPLGFIKNKFLKDTATLQISSMMNQGSQLVSSVVLAFVLGAHGQGLLVLAIMLQGMLYNLLNVGLVQAAISQVAAAAVRDYRDKLCLWLAFVAKSFVIVNTLIIAAGWFVLPWVAEKWYQDPELGYWAFWLCFFPLIDTPRAVCFVAFQGTRRMLSVAKLENACEMMRALFVITGAIVTGSYKGAVLGELLVRLLWNILAYDLYRQAIKDDQGYLPRLSEVLRQIPKVPMRRGLRLGLRVGVVKNTHTLVLRVVPSLVLGGMAGAQWVAWFNVAKRFMEMPLMLMQGITRTALPALSELAGLRDAEAFRRLFTRASLIGGGLVTLGILCFLPLLKPVVRAFYPSDYPEPVLRYALILAAGYIPAAFAVALESFYIVTNQMKRSLQLAFLGNAVTIPTNIYLMIKFPETGAAWGHTVYLSFVIIHLFYVVWFFRSGKYRTIWTTPEERAELAKQRQERVLAEAAALELESGLGESALVNSGLATDLAVSDVLGAGPDGHEDLADPEGRKSTGKPEA